MKRLAGIITLFLMILIVQSVFAQRGYLGLGLGGNLAIVVGDYGDVAGTGYGGTGSILYRVSREAGLNAYSGYISHSKKEESYIDQGTGNETQFKREYQYKEIPAMFGANYIFGRRGPQPYLGGHMGFFWFEGIEKFPELIYLDPDTGEPVADYKEETNTKTKFAWGLAGGVLLGNFDLSAEYIHVVDARQFLIRLAFNIPLKKGS